VPLWDLRVGWCMKKLAFVAVLVIAASPVAAQEVTSNGELPSGNQGALSAPSQTATIGVFCVEEITATFCNVPTAPNTSGYGSSGVSASTSVSGSSGSRDAQVRGTLSCLTRQQVGGRDAA